jgi:hypothetical protein
MSRTLRAVVLNLPLLEEKEMFGNDSFRNKKKKLVFYEVRDSSKTQWSWKNVL